VTPHDVITTLVVPAAAGLLVGFLGGLITGILATLCWVARRRERGEAVPIYTDENNPNPGQVPWRGREHFSRLGWFLAICGVLGLFLGSYSLYRNAQTAACLADFNIAFTVASRERADAAELDRQAIRQQRAVTREFNQAMITAIGHPVTDPVGMEKARSEFLDKVRDWDRRLADVDQLDQQAEQQRRQNPLPIKPDC
jgi:hypothetical protein